MLGGHIRYFCSKAIRGGRCMITYNKKWHVKEELVELDAVSFYPASMKRLYTVECIPKPIPNLEFSKAITHNDIPYFLKDKSAYVVLIEIVKVNKHYAFPLIRTSLNGSTYDDHIIADNSDSALACVYDIELEDLIKFQHIEFKLLNGLYWDGKKDYCIQDIIQKAFDLRNKYKMEGNSLQLIYK